MTGKEGDSWRVKVVKDKKTLDDTWNTLTKDAKEIGSKVDTYGKEIKRMQFEDGTVLQYRLKSKSGGETIEIVVKGEKPRKIHIE